MLQNCVHNRIPCRYVLNDIWFAFQNYIKRTLGKEFIMGRRSPFLDDKQHGRCNRLYQLDLPEDTVAGIYPGAGAFPLYLLRQSCTSRRIARPRYLVTVL